MSEEGKRAAAEIAARLKELTEQRDALAKALGDLIPRFERACVAAGNDMEFVKIATEMHREALSQVTP